jgi:hypothetical protein
MFLEAFDRGAEGNTVRMVMQVRAATRQRRFGKVGHDDFTLVEAGTFCRHDGIVAYGVVTKGNNLVELCLGTTVHIKYSTGFREELRQHVSERRNHFRERTVLENILAKRAPGFEREKNRRFFGLSAARASLAGIAPGGRFL